MDFSDQATDREEKDRAYAMRLQAIKSSGDTNMPETVCNGCSYATRKSWGYSCDAWTECLSDAVRLRRVK